MPKERLDIGAEIKFSGDRVLAIFPFNPQDGCGEALMTFEDFRKLGKGFTRIRSVTITDGGNMRNARSFRLDQKEHAQLPRLVKNDLFACPSSRLEVKSGSALLAPLLQQLKKTSFAASMSLLHSGEPTEAFLRTQINVNTNLKTLLLEGAWPDAFDRFLFELLFKPNMVEIDTRKASNSFTLNFLKGVVAKWQRKKKTAVLKGRTSATEEEMVAIVKPNGTSTCGCSSGQVHIHHSDDRGHSITMKYNGSGMFHLQMK
ncbi:hypothetical protein QR680_016458 [Steinernema hermaphroditum]|uniref:Uncharacterized protein n=1 Tax=Steinernema hermaphroditum TaxID=289476 RepID=A0AA39HB97_9BILA|nr:hypothetical protein QR680_016458 [Steinernema hermaphroditum]